MTAPRFIIYCLFQALVINRLEAQEPSREFGDVPRSQLEMQIYDKDTAADALVLHDIGNSSFIQTDEGFRLIFERRIRIKIFGTSALDQADFSIPFYQDRGKAEAVIELQGITFNLEGEIVRKTELNRKSVFVEKKGNNWYEKKFAMPDVKAGSVFEIHYRISSPFVFLFRRWVFQSTIPVLYSEYSTRMIPFYEYTYMMQGADKLSGHSSYVDKITSRNFGGVEYYDKVYQYVMKEVPAFRDEAFITCIDDYLIKMDFQLSAIQRPSGAREDVVSTWTELSEEMLDHDDFGKFLKKAVQTAREYTDTMGLAGKPDEEKLKEIDRAVKRMLIWNGDNDKYASGSIKQILESKTGNSADINLFLTGMLIAAGIEAKPVLLSTRDHGRIKVDYPFLSFFNYVVVCVKISGKYTCLDGTEPYAKTGEIPSLCFNGSGLIVNEDKEEWLELKTSTRSNFSFETRFSLTPGMDSINEQARYQSTGYYAIRDKRRYSKSKEGTEDFCKGELVEHVTDLKPVSTLDPERPFELEFKRSYPLETLDDRIIIAPFGERPITENPLKMPTRNYPVDLGFRQGRSYSVTIEIPAGYKVISLPEPLLVNNDMITVSYTTATDQDGVLRISGVYQFKKSVYSVLEYQDIRNYFGQIVEKFNEKLILGKL